MDNTRFLRTLALLLLLTMANIGGSASAQEYKLPPAVLGLGAAYDYGTAFALDLRDADVLNNQFSNYAEVRKVGLTLIFPKIFANGFGLSTTISYGLYHLNANGTETRRLTNGGNPVNSPVSILYDLKSQAIEWDLLAYIQVGDIARLESTLR